MSSAKNISKQLLTRLLDNSPDLGYDDFDYSNQSLKPVNVQLSSDDVTKLIELIDYAQSKNDHDTHIDRIRRVLASALDATQAADETPTETPPAETPTTGVSGMFHHLKKKNQLWKLNKY